MDFMAGLIGERHDARQNHQRYDYPAKSSTHSHARLTAAAMECQERTCAVVLKEIASPLIPDECGAANVSRSFRSPELSRASYLSTNRSSVRKNSG
jgi:hypothetical protein